MHTERSTDHILCNPAAYGVTFCIANLHLGTITWLTIDPVIRLDKQFTIVWDCRYPTLVLKNKNHFAWFHQLFIIIEACIPIRVIRIVVDIFGQRIVEVGQ